MDLHARDVHAWAREAGFAFAGVARNLPEPRAGFLATWLARGMQGTMRWMEDAGGRRSDPRRAYPWARSLVFVGLDYLTDRKPAGDPRRAAVSRYAWGRDYHRVMRVRLEKVRERMLAAAPRARVQAFVDTSPVLEKGLAERAGLGWRGKHTNLVRKRHGSWFFLGGLATDLELAADVPARDHCGTCSRCLSVCPTGALVEPYVLDARRCIAYLTIEHRGAIPVELRPGIGNRVFGCDDCQEVCPWNRFATPGTEPEFMPRAQLDDTALVDMLRWSRTEWNRRCKKTPMRRAHYEGFLRNVAVALGNAGDPGAVPVLVERLDDPSALVRGHVAWALGRLGGHPAHQALAARARVETDPAVRQELRAALAAAGAPAHPASITETAPSPE